jgi:hypothetical protein
MSRDIVRWFPFLIPPAYLALVLSLQPTDRLGDPETAPQLGRLFYDDYDMTAFALRGLNAVEGRTPGSPHPSTDVNTVMFREALEQPSTRQPDYFLEYPPAILPLFALSWLVQPVEGHRDVSPVVLDAWHNRIVEHWPRNEREQELWRQFRRAMQIYMVVMTLCLLGLMAMLRAGYEPEGRLSGPIWLLVLPGALYFSLNRFDVLPALLVALSLACLGRRHLVGSAILLGAVTMIKVYPILLAPLFLRFLSAERRACLLWTGTYGVTIVAFFLPPVLAWGWEPTWAPYQFQLSRPPEYGWTLYGMVLPSSWAENTMADRILRLGTVALVGLVLFWNRADDMASLLRRCALILIPFVMLPVFYSPQWLLWFSPLLVPLAGLQPSVRWLAVVLDLMTYLSFPVVYDFADPGTRDGLRAGLVLARFALLVGLAGVLLAEEVRPKPQAALAVQD